MSETTNATPGGGSSVLDILKRGQAQAGTAATAATTTVPGTVTAETATAAATTEAAAPAVEKVSKRKAKAGAPARNKVTDEWIATVTAKANEHFAATIGEGARIEFTVARSKGRPVSLTPRIIGADGSVRSAGPKNRVGFCTDGNFDSWYPKLNEALQFALAKTARVKSTKTPSARSSRWSPITDNLRGALGPLGYRVRTVGKRLVVAHDSGQKDDKGKTIWDARFGLQKDAEGKITISSAGGDPMLVTGDMSAAIRSALTPTSEA